MLIVTEDKMRDLLNLLWLNTDKIRHIEIVDCPSRFGEPTESKISIQMMCQIKGKEDALFSLNALPTIDAVPVVRCKDCKHRPTRPEDARGDFDLMYPDDICPLQCGDPWYNQEPDDDWFCANGERSEDGET